ncbi:hypothetical protein L914_18573 [Phytophthora nicotianae]|nr:hypothetical protein L914_18573 [Phytophthora nicotianae]
MGDAKCERIASSVSGWKVHCFNETHRCDDVEWTCTCLFYSSHHLPCCHLMYVADKEHEFELLPAMSIGERWSMSCALNVMDDLAAAAATLHPILLISKLKLPKVRSPYGSPHDEQFKETGVQKPMKEVVYVRLRRNERAHQVVLSSAEKYSYAKAMLEPLLDHLSSLSSAEFYQELNTWK